MHLRTLQHTGGNALTQNEQARSSEFVSRDAVCSAIGLTQALNNNVGNTDLRGQLRLTKAQPRYDTNFVARDLRVAIRHNWQTKMLQVDGPNMIP